ncbi:hypothetical protein P7C70_g2440, partial [Phenoliferia sp. Uapishka_3]
MSPSIFIVGANRGIGLGLVKESLKRDPTSQVFATARDVANATDLLALQRKHPGQLHLLQLDILDETSVDAAVTKLKESTDTLDLVIINAGVLLGMGKIEELSASDLLSNFNTNVVGPHIITRAFSPFLLSSTSDKRILAYISSIGGSTTLVQSINDFVKEKFEVDYAPASAYTTSKAGLNQLGRQWAQSLEPKGVAVPLIHPGQVSTDMNPLTGDGYITTDESAEGIFNVLNDLKVEDTGKGILSYDGTIQPW